MVTQYRSLWFVVRYIISVIDEPLWKGSGDNCGVDPTQAPFMWSLSYHYQRDHHSVLNYKLIHRQIVWSAWKLWTNSSRWSCSVILILIGKFFYNSIRLQCLQRCASHCLLYSNFPCFRREKHELIAYHPLFTLIKERWSMAVNLIPVPLPITTSWHLNTIAAVWSCQMRPWNITDHRIKYSSIFIIHHVITIQSPSKKKWSTTYFTIIILTNIYFVNIFMQM